MKALRLALAGLAGIAALAIAADSGEASAFRWRATLDTAGQQGLMRVSLPATALAHLQTRDAADLRLFDARGRPVAFALARPRNADTPRGETAPLPALPLHAATATQAPRGAVQVHVDQKDGQRSVQVQVGDAAGPAANPDAGRRLPAALFDTRKLTEPLDGIVVRASLPANAPVHFTLSTSADLANWTPVPARGRIYRFEGDAAPANDTLAFAAPLRLADRYLRLDWSGQEGIVVEAVTGLVAAALPRRDPPALDLPAPVADGSSALEWSLDFATPIAHLELAIARPQALVPVRVLGRSAPSERWRLLGQTVVHRLAGASGESGNLPLALQGVSVRWLRVEATHGMQLEGAALTARVLFEPLDLVFPAGEAGPYRLAAGRGGAPSTALPLSLLASAASTRIDALPLATVASVEVEHEHPSYWQGWLPRGVDGRTAGLWLVLVCGVLLLGAVAWSLLKQAGRDRDSSSRSG